VILENCLAANQDLAPISIGGNSFREGVTFYNVDFRPKKRDIGFKNTCK
jgi:hypothetical protein